MTIWVFSGIWILFGECLFTTFFSTVTATMCTLMFTINVYQSTKPFYLNCSSLWWYFCTQSARYTVIDCHQAVVFLLSVLFSTKLLFERKKKANTRGERVFFYRHTMDKQKDGKLGVVLVLVYGMLEKQKMLLYARIFSKHVSRYGYTAFIYSTFPNVE